MIASSLVGLSCLVLVWFFFHLFRVEIYSLDELDDETAVSKSKDECMTAILAKLKELTRNQMMTLAVVDDERSPKFMLSEDSSFKCK